MILVFLLILIVTFLVYRHFTWQAVPWPEGALMPPKYQGHRGYWKEGAQENTLASFESAAKRGLKMVEMDIRLSKDGIPVVFHDTDLKRLANLQKNVSECTALELRTSAQVPTLEEILLSRDIPQFLNIEFKTSKALNGDLEKKAAELIQKHQAEKRILFSSFNPLALWRLSHLLPNVPRALLATKEKDSENKFYLRYLLFAPYVNIHALHLDYHYVDTAQIEKWKQRKVPVALWTVNEKEKAEAYLKAGALSIISDTLGEA